MRDIAAFFRSKVSSAANTKVHNCSDETVRCCRYLMATSFQPNHDSLPELYRHWISPVLQIVFRHELLLSRE